MEARGVRSSWLTVEMNSPLSFSTACRSDTSRTLPAKVRPAPPARELEHRRARTGTPPPLLRWPFHSVMRPIARAKAVRR